MRKRNLLFVAAACTATLAVTLVKMMRTHSQESEPTYEGRSLSEWMATNAISAVSGDISTSDKAEEAIRKIGTNAIPYLLRWIAEEPPIPPSVAAKLPESVTQNRAAQLVIDGPHNERAFDSTYAFSILGPDASCAIPQLKLLMADTRRPVTAHRAITALAYMGPSALPTMLSAFADTNHPYRGDMAFAMGTFMGNDIEAARIIQPFVAALSDSDLNVRTAATNILSQHFPETFKNSKSR